MKKQLNTDIVQILEKKKVPVNIHWIITNRCNERCIHCLRDNRKVKELSLEQIKNIILHLKQEGCFNLAFSGGEPFIRKDFMEILAFSRKEQFAVSVLSNGTLLNEKKIRLLKKIRPQSVQLSLYGATAKMHDSITGAKGSFVKTINAIRLLKKYKIPFGLVGMGLNKNFSELFQLKEMARKNHWSIFFDFTIFPAYTGSLHPLNLRASDEQLRIARQRKLLRWRSDLPVKQRDTKSPITVFEHIPAITAEGDVLPTLLTRIKLGNLRQRSFHRPERP